MNDPRCQYCGNIHYGVTCPRIKAFDYHPDGTVARVEFFAPKDYPPLVGPAEIPQAK